MSGQIDDGGRAFPLHAHFGSSGELPTPNTGMSLRDWFAGQATEADIEAHLGGTISPQTGNAYGCRAREQAKCAYADAMIAARKGGAK